MKAPARSAILFLAACGLFPADAPAQTAPFRDLAVTPVAEAFSPALPVIAGDVDGDGMLDLLIGTNDQILLFRGTGTAHVNGGEMVFSGKRIRNLALADFDGDGIPDLAALTQGAVLVFKAEAPGSFVPTLTFDLQGEPARGFAAADLNGDGAIDLVAGQESSVLLLPGNGAGNFCYGGEFATGSIPNGIVVADFNNDGIPDLATANYPNSDDLSILLGTGAGTFQSKIRVLASVGPYSDRPYALAAGDFDRDGKLDLAVAADGIAILLGNGDGTFAKGAGIPDDSSPMSMAVGDLDGDGFPDIVAGDYYGGRISVALNNGDGTFRTVRPLTAIGDVFGLALADLNGDSSLDVIASSYSSQSALIALGGSAGTFQAPVYLGYFDNALLRPFGQDLAVVMPYRKSISLLKHGTEASATLFFDDYPVDTLPGDFNRNGTADLAVLTVPAIGRDATAPARGAIHVLAGAEDGSFKPLARIEAGQWGAFSVGDFTGDGNPDIAFNDDFSDTVQILAGKGDGAFEPAAALAPGGAIALAAADFNGDGIQDLAALRASGITVYAGSRTAITESGRYETLAAALHLLTGDFDGDSRPDLIAGTGGQLGLLLNTGAGSFRPVPVSAGSLNFWRTTPMAIADFDRDGKDDIVITAGYYRLEGGLGPGLVLMSNGDGSFQRLELPLARGTVALAAEDWDEDGNPDILLLNGITGAVTIMRNER